VRYPVTLLRRWKAEAEDAALEEVEGRAGRQLTDYSADIDITYLKKKIDGERHDYGLQVTLANHGIEPIGPYHVDLTMPAIVVENPKAQPSYVPENSTRDDAFFRVSHREINREIYPGDSRIVLSIPYYIDRKIYWGRYERGGRRDLFSRLVRVTLYHYGFQPLTVETPFRDFQNF
jgi:hypothetical protein